MLMYSEYLVKQSLDLQKILCISHFEPDFKSEKSKLSIITEVHNIFKLYSFLDTSLINKVQYNIVTLNCINMSFYNMI